MDILTPGHIILVLVGALLIFGPKRLPDIGKSLGKGIREFKGALNHITDDEPAAPPTPAPAPPPAPGWPPAPAAGEQQVEARERLPVDRRRLRVAQGQGQAEHQDGHPGKLDDAPLAGEVHAESE